MDNWLEEAKEVAASEARRIIEELTDVANEKDLEPEWFIEEVVKNIHKLKGEK